MINAMNVIQQDYPLVRFHIISGDKEMITEAIDRGSIDFGIIFENIDNAKYASIPINYKDTWGVLMRRDAELSKERICDGRGFNG